MQLKYPKSPQISFMTNSSFFAYGDNITTCNQTNSCLLRNVDAS